MATTGTENNPSTRNSGGEQHMAEGIQDFGRELDQCENRIQQLQTALIDATTAKHELVDALRNLSDQFNSLQEHADKQCDVLADGGEEVCETERRLASLQEQIASTREDFERSQEDKVRQALAEREAASADAETEYRDALCRMEQALKEREAAAAEQEKDNAELVERIMLLERRCAELDSRRVERESACEELRQTLDYRTSQVDRMNRYVIRVQRELKILNEEIHKSESGISPINSELFEPDGELAMAEPSRENNRESSVSPFTLLRPVSSQKQDGPEASQGDECQGGEAIEEPEAGSVSEQFIIVPVGSKDEDTQYPLNKEELTIGRGRDHDIPIMERGVSRVHARIVLRGFKVFIEDMGSKFGVLVNSEPRERQELKHGDKFKIGRKEFELVDLAIRVSGLHTTPAA